MRLAISAMLLALAQCASYGEAYAQAPRLTGPTSGYEIEADYTEKSPDGATVIEQYVRIGPDGSYTWQFWARRADAMTMLEPEQPDYSAAFRFTHDSRWVVRMQKTGAGYADLYLYTLKSDGFAAATQRSLGELAWAFFKRHPDSEKIGVPTFHIAAGLVKGTEDNYRWMGVQWPDSRYLVLTLSGEVEPTSPGERPRFLTGWHCRYDLQSGSFDVPDSFLENNAKSVGQ